MVPLIDGEATRGPGAKVRGVAPGSGSRPVVRHRRRYGGLVALAVLLALITTTAAAGVEWHWFAGSPKSGTNNCPSGQTLQGNGAQVLTQLADIWSKSFDSATSDSVNYVAGGSGVGLTDLTDRTVDFAATDNPLSPSQRAALPSP
ncbi:MAG: substrate-binding domain-containing protein, partial [Thermoplasmata archaeon]|nr:substrate-binding domain-containing protein [Thermoplasmata archaeon]